jgi:hypothetical protein
MGVLREVFKGGGAFFSEAFKCASGLFGAPEGVNKRDPDFWGVMGVRFWAELTSKRRIAN